MRKLPIDVIDAEPHLELEEVNEMIHAMDSETRIALRAVFEMMVETIAGKRGSMVVVMDREGLGAAQMVAMGNVELVPFLLESSAHIASQMYKPHEGTVIQ